MVVTIDPCATLSAGSAGGRPRFLMSREVALDTREGGRRGGQTAGTRLVGLSSRLPSVCSDNILVLDIYFEALNYETIEQKKAYELAGLLGKETAPGAGGANAHNAA